MTALAGAAFDGGDDDDETDGILLVDSIAGAPAVVESPSMARHWSIASAAVP